MTNTVLKIESKKPKSGAKLWKKPKFGMATFHFFTYFANPHIRI